MKTTTPSADSSNIADGKRRLIIAALKLSAGGTPLMALGLRELAREAGLNHNTFYRHFGQIEDLGRAAAELIAQRIMAGMKEVRQQALKHADMNRAAADYFLQFVLKNPEAFIVGVREANSLGTPMRAILQGVLEQIAAESVEQITSMKLATGLTPATVKRATTAITEHMFRRALDCIEEPAQQEAIAAEIAEFVRMQFLGAAALPAE